MGVLGGNGFKYNNEPRGALHGLTGEHIRAVSWHERTQHVSRAEPSAPSKLNNKPSVEHFLCNNYTKKKDYFVNQTIENQP